MRFERDLFVLFLSVWLLLAGQPASAEDIGSPAPGQPPVVRARMIEPGDGVFRPSASHGRVQRPNHPPIDEIPEILLPEPRFGTSEPGGSTAVLQHDALVGETTEVLVEPLPGQEPGQRRGYRGLPEPSWSRDQEKTFTDMIQVYDTSLHPWRMVVKLVSRFTDVGGIDRYNKCTGAMIDAETVLTAGHCVWLEGVHDYQQVWHVINDYAQEIWVYPGWGGDLGDVDEEWFPDFLGAGGGVIDPYGFGYSDDFFADDGWINGQSGDADRGLIRINRAVGMLTGWFGTVWGEDCGLIMSRTHHNASFPKGACNEGDSHLGDKMWYWLGSIDSCPGERLRFDTMGGCSNSLFSGMSGSPLWWAENGELLIDAVVASGSSVGLPGYADCPRLTQSWLEHTYDTFIPGSRGYDFDLQALDVNGPVGIQAGSQLGEVTFLAANPTNGSSSGAWSFDVYLSSDDVIEDTDTFLGAYTSQRPWSPMDSDIVTLDPPPVIPIDTPGGFQSYWLGVILDPATDIEPSNNTTQFWDAHRLTVFGVSDLVAQGVEVPDGSYDYGQYLNISFEVVNQGGVDSDPITVDIRASTNEYISLVDPLLRSFEFDPLEGGEMLDEVWVLTVPYTLSAGDWYIGILLHADNDLDESNNWAVDPDPIQIVPSVIFADGFENGSTSGWSLTEPPSMLYVFDGLGMSGALGGRYGVDQQCLMTLAGSYPGLPDANVHALITVWVDDEIRDMPVNYGVPTNAPIVGPTGTQIADNWADLLDGTIDVSLYSAGIMSGGAGWYSGSDQSGTFVPKTCDAWTSPDNLYGGRFGGKLATDAMWIAMGDANCGLDFYHILCLAWD